MLLYEPPQAEEAGAISHYQLVLAGRMGDDLLAVRSKIYAAYSLLQRSRVRQAAKIVRLVSGRGGVLRGCRGGIEEIRGRGGVLRGVREEVLRW